ncbi:hypothetical protein Pmani_035595 [Petrolisthes manimaculis]|uniref:Uncharacterized protein n=1 Tax=Petrolisthes manimaculis TaxID=1843537 RepID=A0AAE1NM36_9EUCA|nr:hypothetical protein Pmani_035595 [Petrolisthes manimaculis]
MILLGGIDQLCQPPEKPQQLSPEMPVSHCTYPVTRQREYPTQIEVLERITCWPYSARGTFVDLATSREWIKVWPS